MPLKIYQRGEIWHYRGTVAGQRLRGSCQTADRKTAQRIAAEIEARAWKGHLDGPEATLTMAQVFTAYLDAGKPDRYLLKLVEHWKDTLVSTIRPETIRRAAKKIYPAACEATWNRQVIKPTQAAINYAAELGWCSRITVKKFPENPKEKTPATLGWVRAFVVQAVKDGLPELAALCLFMFGTAARISEACRMTWADVDLTDRRATLHLFKPTPWDRVAHLPADVVAALANIPTNRDPDALVFGYENRSAASAIWSKTIRRAGIQHLTPHCCRHGFATTMLRKGFDVKTRSRPRRMEGR